MLICRRKIFWQGILLLCSFAMLFALILAPVFKGENGARLTGLEFADETFNELSKGSSYFIPQVRASVQALGSSPLKITVKIARPEFMAAIKTILEKKGAVAIDQDSVTFAGNLEDLLLAATEDSQLLYDNAGAGLSEKYAGLPPLTVAQGWWQFLNPCIKSLRREMKLKEADTVDDVVRRALEPGNNFYGLNATNVSEHILLVLAFLSFYILYTLWYGIGIYKIFEGTGLIASDGKDS